ncbi:MAG: hypothetical protein J6D21_12190 [Clostridia bacterium]|nr:hypothetical protein [Clostridia bacterium]
MKRYHLLLLVLLLVCALALWSCGDQPAGTTPTETGGTTPADTTACPHVFETWETVREPNCIEEGLRRSRCTACGAESYETLAATGVHTEVTDPAVNPTCTEPGVTAGAHCAVCGTVTIPQTELSPLDHRYDDDLDAECNLCGELRETVCRHLTVVLYPAKEATCEEWGLTEGRTCSLCGEVLTEQTVVSALGHTEETEPGVEATCTEDGLTERIHCTVCGKVLKEQTVIHAPGHTEVVDEAVAPTCTEDGITEGSHCTACGAILVEQTKLEAKGHTLVKTEAKEATANENGNLAYWTCTDCGTYFGDAEGKTVVELADQIIAATGHSLVATAPKDATRTESGNIAYWTCQHCNKHFSDGAGKLEIALADTVIAPKGHTLTSTAKTNATCTEKGNVAYYSCSACGKHFLDGDGTTETTLAATVIEAKGHTLTATAAKASTCTKTGNIAYYSCTTCGKLYGDAQGRTETTLAATVIPVTSHTLVSTAAKAATCTESGNITYWTCGVCQKLFRDAGGRGEITRAETVVSAKGHTLTATAERPATCTEPGHTAYYSCSACGKHYKDADGRTETTLAATVLPAMGHSYTDGTCTGCGAELGDAPAVLVDTVYVTPSDATVKVTVSLANNPGLSSLKLYITYGPELTLTEIAFSSAFGAYVTAPTPYASPLPVTFISPFEDVEASGTFATLTFRLSKTVTAGAQLPISVSVDEENTYNVDFESVALVAAGGKIVVRAE